MKRRIYFTLFVILTSLTAYSQDIQDTIIKTNGEKILCKIQKEDSASVYFSTTKDNQEIYTFLNRSSITSVRFGAKQTGQNQRVYKIDKTSIGIGLGFDYGGIGGNVLIYPQRNIGLFFGLGSAIAGLGYNVGVKLRFINKIPTTGVSPYLIGMYGYNTAIGVTNGEQYNKLFYGTTLGIGLDYRPRRAKKNYWAFSLLFPIRGSDVDNYMTYLEAFHGIVFKNELSSVAISIGYRFGLN